jgi:2-keto-4-pentenoate hydratase
VLSAFEPALSDPGYAYAVQRAFAHGEKPISGWRAFFTSPVARQQIGVTGSGYARLGHARHLVRPPHVLRHAAWQRPFVEMGLAARLTSLPVRFPVRPEDLAPRVLGWMAMVVVSDLGFAPGTRPDLADFIAVNAGGGEFMTGPLVRDPALGLAALRPSLSLAGRQVAWGRVQDAGGAPLAVLAGLLDRLHAAKEPVQAEHIFFTGGLGRLQPLSPGRYVAEFGVLGRIEFEARRALVPPRRQASP